MAFDDETLKRLRARYGEGRGGNIHDPEFRAVADRIFSASGTRAAPYSGIPTLLDATYRLIDAHHSRCSGVSLGVFLRKRHDRDPC